VQRSGTKSFLDAEADSGRASRRAGAFFCAAIIFLAWGAGAFMALSAKAATVEFNIPTIGAFPETMVLGPDHALWFAEYWTSRIGRVDTNGVFLEYVTPTQPSNPFGIVTGPDKNLWFTEAYTNKIGRITTNGVFTEFNTPTPKSRPSGITVGPDGNLWFLEIGVNKVGRVDTNGTNFAEFTVGTGTNLLYNIITAPDGNLWFTESFDGTIGRITTNGTVTEFPLPSTNCEPFDIIVGPDNALWFSEFASNKIGRITTDAIPGNFSFITEYPLPIDTNTFVTNQPYGMMVGPDSNIWFADYGGSSIGRMTTSGVVTKFFTPTTNSFPSFLATGADSNIWFGEIIASSPGFTHNIARFSVTTVTPQLLTIAPDAGFQNVILSWTTNGTNFQLQLNNDLTTTNWVNVTNVPVVTNGVLTVTNAISGNAFYRLLQ
jgi:virginiamycin B lyase